MSIAAVVAVAAGRLAPGLVAGSQLVAGWWSPVAGCLPQPTDRLAGWLMLMLTQHRLQSAPASRQLANPIQDSQTKTKLQAASFKHKTPAKRQQSVPAVWLAPLWPDEQTSRPVWLRRDTWM